ncbi:DUF1885 family protein, partial [Escherichia coli]|nr:DUF1885 family protein [Escherichia coli]
MLAANSFIKLVPSSAKENISTEELKELFLYYKDITGKTGSQIKWEYNDAAFPYEIKEKPEAKGTWFYLYS